MLIGIIMMLMILGGAVTLALIGRAVTRKASPRRRGLIVLLMAIAGLESAGS